MSNQIETQTQASLGTYLKKKRVERGLTQSEVASKLGYGSPQFISNIERGISSVPLKSLKVIIDLYQLPADEVLDVLVSEKKNYWREQLGIGQDENLQQATQQSRQEQRPMTGQQTMRPNDPSNSTGQQSQEDEDTPILYSSQQDRFPESGV